MGDSKFIQKLKIDDYLIIFAILLPIATAIYLTLINAEGMGGILFALVLFFISIPLIVIALVIHFTRIFKSRRSF